MNKVNVIKQNLEFIGKTWMKCIGTFASILSLFFLFWTWDDIRITSTQYKCVIIILLCVLALILAILWTCIFKRTKTIWESPSGKIKVCYSDIMKDGFDKRNKEEKLFVIPVNSCFDTIVDEDISTCSKPLVSPNSLHGRWIKTMVNKGFTIEEIDNKIHNCLEMQNLVPKSIIADEDKERGKREVYELGTVAMIRGNNNSTFLLLAISEYDKDNIAHTSVDDLEMCIKSLLNFYDQHGQGHFVKLSQEDFVAFAKKFSELKFVNCDISRVIDIIRKNADNQNYSSGDIQKFLLYIDVPKYIKEYQRFGFDGTMMISLLKMLHHYEGNWIMTWSTFLQKGLNDENPTLYDMLYTQQEMQSDIYIAHGNYERFEEKVPVKVIYNMFDMIDKDKNLFVFIYRDKNKNKQQNIVFVTDIDFDEIDCESFFRKYKMEFNGKEKLLKLKWREFKKNYVKFS